MSRKRRIKLLRGKFYFCYTVGIHPALIFKKNKKKNRYDALIFGTTEGHHRIILKKPLSKGINKSVIHSKPLRGTRIDFGDRELEGMKVSKEDKPLLNSIKKIKPQETKSYKKNKKMRQASKSSTTR